jgi:hypothetical protein
MATHPKQKANPQTAPDPDDAGTTEPESQPNAVATASGPTLAQRMALPEPARTLALEAAASRGEQFYLRAKAQAVKVPYGDLVLTLGREAKGFSAAHAIHILWKRPELVEEVEV